MTCLTIYGRVDVPFFLQRPANLGLSELVLFAPIFGLAFGLTVFLHKLRRFNVVRFPVEIKNLILGSQEILGMTMAFQTPRHAVGLSVIDRRHVINITVATGAADPAIDVGRVIVKNVIGRAMDLHPLDWFTGFPAGPNWFELWIIFLDLLMAIHANLRGR